MAFSISTDRQSNQFKKHLREEGNDRIIFSGPFGIGKTYFLDNFFSKPNTDYLAIKLAPINYSVSSNEDIFKLIKYDILVEAIVTHGLIMDPGKEIRQDIAYGTILPSKIEAIVTALLPILPLLNKSVESVPILFTALLGLIQISRNIETQRTEASAPSQPMPFGEEMIKQYLIESDEITSYLETALSELAEKRKAKYKVLVIDDLDRIDPEHVFRLFNIFSAHLDYNKSLKNKFGFDKVIFVCDIYNVRNVFHSRYGSETDFTGYIDKFFSQEIFYFSNEEEVRQIAKDFVGSINPVGRSSEYIKENILSGRNHQEQSILEIILIELILSGTLRMRRIINSNNMSYELPAYKLQTGTSQRGAGAWQMPILGTIQLLVKIMGGGDALEKSLRIVNGFTKSMDYREITQESKKWLLGNIIPVLGFHTHKFRISQPHANAEYAYRNDAQEAMFYKLLEIGGNREMYFAEIENQTGAFDFFYLLHQTVKLLLRDGIIK